MKTALVILLLAGCQTSLDQRLAIVRTPRVLAIVSDPAEVLPGQAASYSALVAGPDGPIAAMPSWALCTAPKPPTEDNAVSTACVAGDGLVSLGSAASVTATVPGDACTNFGPDVPPGGFRPRDPDPTGGYYQPVRADAGVGDLAFGFTRITCHLPNTTGDIAHDYQMNYHANVNPTLEPLELSVPADQVPAGATVTLTASWPASAVESYLYFDPQGQRLVTRRESMRLSWFATGGELAVDASAVGEADTATSVSTTWHAPDAPGTAWLWLVLRDSRGGTATQAVQVTLTAAR